VREHFDTPRTKLYCAMGVSGSPEVLRSVIDIVGDLDIQTLVVTTTILGEEVWNSSKRVLVVPHVPAHLANPLADVAITHAAAGTIQTAIHSGTPLVGVPMQLEQAGNISLVERQGAGTMLSKLDLNRAQLTTALEKIVADDRYRKNMLRLKQIQDRVDGATNAARQIMSFLEERG